MTFCDEHGHELADVREVPYVSGEFSWSPLTIGLQLRTGWLGGEPGSPSEGCLVIAFTVSAAVLLAAILFRCVLVLAWDGGAH